MALSAFDDRSRVPGTDEVREMLGRASARWDELISRISAEHAPIEASWIYSGASWGWSLRLKRKKRAVLYLTPRRRHFLAGFALGEKAVAAAHESDLPASTLALIDGARKYAEGRAVRLEVRTKKDLGTVTRLAAIKLAN